MRMRLLTTAVLASAALLGACDGGDAGGGVTDPGAKLSQADMASLNRAIMGVGTGVAQGGASQSVSGNRAPSEAVSAGTFSTALDYTVPCQPGGTLGVKGTLGGAWNTGATTAQLQAAFSVAHNACRVHSDDGGTIEITGSPDIDFTFDAAANASGITTLRLTEKGAFQWVKGSSSGTCSLDVVAELVPGTKNQMRVTGDFCGTTVNATFTG